MAILFLKYGRHIDVRTIKTVEILRKTIPNCEITAYNPIQQYNKFKIINIYYYIKSIYNTIKTVEKHKPEFIWSVDMYGGVAAYLIKLIFKVNYIYEVYDESFLNTKNILLSKILLHIDKIISKSSAKTIRVEEYRKQKESDVVIKNLPSNKISKYNKIKKNHRPIVVIAGQLIDTRGINQAIEFAKNNKDIYLAIFGENPNVKTLQQIKTVSNIYYFGRVEQARVYKFCARARAQFALYDPSIKININAASNKFYEGTPLNILTIINKEIKYVKITENINLIPVNYNMTKQDFELINKHITTEIRDSRNQNTKPIYFEDEFRNGTNAWITDIY